MPRYISNKKLYDTDTAEVIGTYERSLHSGHQSIETLYRTAKDNWFVCGTYSGDPPIHPTQWFCPLSSREAMERLEKYGETDLLVELFNIEIA
jgi:FAD synthase